MTTTSERKAFLRRVQTALRGVFAARLRGVILYGSEARGTARPDSDIDLLVLLAGPVDLATDLVAVHGVLYPIALELGRRISAKPVDAEQYESIECPLYNAVHREGLPA
ncbi:MAG: nucleotidyltransferase family protein [Thermoguttaceae bacterium]